MPLTRQRVGALRRLALLYARHVVRRAAQRRPQDGLRRFAELYSADRITAVTPSERRQLPGHGRCIACGLCGFAAARSGYLRPDRLPAQLTRTLPGLWTARELALEEVDWKSAAAVCPVGVPLEEMAGFVRDRLRSEGTAPPALQVAPTLPVAAT